MEFHPSLALAQLTGLQEAMRQADQTTTRLTAMDAPIKNLI